MNLILQNKKGELYTYDINTNTNYNSIAEDLFNIYQPSYDMLFIAYSETDKFKTHDGTARLQLVNNKSNSFLIIIFEY